MLVRHNVQALTLHTAARDISGLDNDARCDAVDEVSAGFGALGELDGFAAIVPPCQPVGSAAADPAPRIDAFRQSLAVLSERARKAGIRVACENLPSMAGEPPCPLSLMGDLRAVVDDFPANVGVCLDTGHAVLNGRSPIDEARVAGGPATLALFDVTARFLARDEVTIRVYLQAMRRFLVRGWVMLFLDLIVLFTLAFGFYFYLNSGRLETQMLAFASLYFVLVWIGAQAYLYPLAVRPHL